MAEPVHIFAADHPRQYRNLRQKFIDEYQERLKNILHADSEKDFHYRRGFIHGLGRAMLICEELEKEERK